MKMFKTESNFQDFVQFTFQTLKPKYKDVACAKTIFLQNRVFRVMSTVYTHFYIV